MYKTLLDFLIKGIVSVILNGPSCKDSNAQFTTVRMLHLYDQYCGIYCIFSSSDNCSEPTIENNQNYKR